MITADRLIIGGTTSGTTTVLANIVSTPDARFYDTVFVGRQARDLWYKSADVYNAYATARRVSFGQDRKSPIEF